MSLSVVKTGAALGAETRGLDLSKTIDDDTFEKRRGRY